MTGKELKDLRKAKGLSQQQFGEVLGYAPSGAKTQISKFETGKTPIPARISAKLRGAGGPRWICGKDEDGNKTIAHLHTPKFSAKIKDDTGINAGLSAAVKDTGDVLCDFVFYDQQPTSEDLLKLISEAVVIWSKYACKD